MKYRKFGTLDWEVSVLGFGAMRLPIIGNDISNVDKAEAIRMIRYAIDHGVNYLDTAWTYHQGRGEHVVGQALKDGYREKVKLVTKLPARLVESARDFDRFFNEQMERLQTEKVDFYLLHGLNSQNWPLVRDLGVLNWAEDKMTKGKFDHLGFSFHDGYDVFKEIVDSYDNWLLALILYNYLDVDFQAGRRGLEYASSKDLAIAVMEPLKGGQLAKDPTAPVARIWDTATLRRTMAEWGLLWVWNQPGVSVVLSGMSTMEQVKENIAIAEGAGSLTAEELTLIEKVREAYSKLIPIPCSGCGYCTPCPSGVDIPHILQMYNDATIYGELEAGRFRYNNPDILKEEHRADQCVECDECLEACPQQIPITEWLKKTHKLLNLER